MAIFDKEAINYDQWYKTKLGAFVDEVETKLVLSLFKPTEGMKILDVGCGTGNFSIKLAEMGFEVIGIDISEDMLAKARKKANEKGLNIQFRIMDVYNLDFSDNTFDGVLSMAAFEFIKKPQDAYNEIYRVLKQSGKILIGTINRESSWGELYLSKQFQDNSIFKYAEFKSINELKSLNNAEIVDSGECLFIPPNTEEKNVNMKLEEELSTTEGGGFICVLWKKEA